MEDLVRGRKEHKRQTSGKRKTNSQNAKRPTSPKGSTFYNPIDAVDQLSYKETMYANRQKQIKDLTKATQNTKQIYSKKQARIRSASPGVGSQQFIQTQNFLIHAGQGSSIVGVTGNKIKMKQLETAQKINAALATAKGFYEK